MHFLISTVATDVLIEDLGAFIQHPTADRDLALEFGTEELSNSADLTEAISSGQLTLKMNSQDYLQTQIDAYYYNPRMVLDQTISAFAMAEEFVKASELRSADRNIKVYEGVFPVGISSTSALTKTLISSGASFESWRVFAGDILVITGGPAAGTYTVDFVQSQTSLVVIEELPGSLAVGTLEIYNPPGAATIGVDPTGLSNVTSSNLQQALTELDSAVTSGGITELYHENIDSLIHNLSEDSYEEVILTGNKITSITTYTDVTKAVKIREYLYTYSGTKILQETAIQYSSNVEVQRLVSSYTYSGTNISSIAHTETP